MSVESLAPSSGIKTPRVIRTVRQQMTVLQCIAPDQDELRRDLAQNGNPRNGQRPPAGAVATGGAAVTGFAPCDFAELEALGTWTLRWR